jgi:hypothetical protein
LGNSRPGTERNPQASSVCAYIIIIGTARDASESIMSEWNYVRNNAAGSLWGAPNHYCVWHCYNAVDKITGGFSPAVKSGESKTMVYAVALTEVLLYDSIRRKI